MADEDRRIAVGISITLSTQLISAALAMLAILAGYISFALGQRETGVPFIIACTISFLSFIVSIFVAGKAITKGRDAGFDGKWSLSEGKNGYNTQAIACLIGMIGFVMTILFSGKPSEDQSEALLRTAVQELHECANGINQLKAEISRIKGADSRLEPRIERYIDAQQRFESRLNALTDEVKTIKERPVPK